MDKDQVVTVNLKRLFDKHAGDKRALDMLEFAALLEQAQALYKLAHGTPIAPLVRETFSALGAFTMSRLGYTIEEFTPIRDAVAAAIRADFDATMAGIEDGKQAERIEESLRLGEGVEDVRDVLAKAARKGDTLH